MVRSSFLFSLAFHALVLGVGFYFARELRPRIHPAPSPSAIQVRLTSTPGDSSGSAKADPKQVLRRRRKGPSIPSTSQKMGAEVSLQRLFEAPGARFTPISGEGEAESGNVAHGPDSAGRQRLAGGSGAGEIYRSLPDATWLNALYERVDRNLIYPPELGQAGIQGDVVLELHFGLADSPRPTITKVKTSSPYLRVAVMRTMNRIFAEPATGKLRQIPPNRHVTAHFTFEVTEAQSDAAVNARSLRAGQTMVFYRNVVKSKTDWKLGPFAGSFLGLVVPGAPAINLNPDWILDQTRQLRQHTKSDPLESYRHDPEFKDS